jgi:hypothetical protein
MSRILKTEWIISPTTTPQPWIACSTCGEPRPFICSGRLRLNANGKKLDAWLIYRCGVCDRTWNRTLFERRHVRSISPDVLAALHSNDPEWIRSRAFDIDALRRHAQHIGEFADADVQKTAVNQPDGWEVLKIQLRIPIATSRRLDRLLAGELGISRSRLQALEQDRRLRMEPGRKAALKRPPGNGSLVVLDLSGEADRLAIGRRACGKERG